MPGAGIASASTAGWRFPIRPHAFNHRMPRGRASSSTAAASTGRTPPGKVARGAGRRSTNCMSARFDGVQLDAVHVRAERSGLHCLYALAETVRATMTEDRHLHLVLENDKNEARYLERDSLSYFTAQSNDDIHHVLHLLLTGETGGY